MCGQDIASGIGALMSIAICIGCSAAVVLQYFGIPEIPAVMAGLIIAVLGMIIAYVVGMRIARSHDN